MLPQTRLDGESVCRIMAVVDKRKAIKLTFEKEKNIGGIFGTKFEAWTYTLSSCSC